MRVIAASPQQHTPAAARAPHAAPYPQEEADQQEQGTASQPVVQIFPVSVAIVQRFQILTYSIFVE